MTNTEEPTPQPIQYDNIVTLSMTLIEIFYGTVIMVISCFGWFLRAYKTKVDQLETRMVKLETIIELLGNIKQDINEVKLDVVEIKTKIEK